MKIYDAQYDRVREIKRRSDLVELRPNFQTSITLIRERGPETHAERSIRDLYRRIYAFVTDWSRYRNGFLFN